MLEGLISRLTAGGLSSSLIMKVTCWFPFSIPFATPVISKMTASSTSSKISCIPVTVVVPVVWPAGMIIVEEAKV